MKHLSCEEFITRFPCHEGHVGVIGWPADLTVDRDTAITGVVNGNVVVATGAQALIAGVVKGSLLVEPDAEVYLTGTIEGDVKLDGNAWLTGRVKGSFQGSAGAHLCSNAIFGA